MSKIINSFYSGDNISLIDDFLDKLHYEYQAAAQRAEKFHDKYMRNQYLTLYQRDAGDLAFQQAFSRHVDQGAKWEPKNNSNRSFRYSYGVAGGIRFSINRLAHNGATPRWANFRANHALTNQYSLFADMSPSAPDLPYCLILHGPVEKFGEQLGFVRIVLPDPNLEMYIEKLELPVAAMNFAPVQTEAELPDAEPKSKLMEKQNIG